MSVALDLQAVQNGDECGSPTAPSGSNPIGYSQRCSASQKEAQKLLNKYQNAFTWNPSADPNQELARFQTQLKSLTDRSSKCCSGSTGCEVVGTEPTAGASGGGTPQAGCTDAARNRWQGLNAAHRAGVCGAVKVICSDFMSRSTSSVPSGVTALGNWASVAQTCDGMDYHGDITDAESKYRDGDQSEATAATASSDPTNFTCAGRDPNDPNGGGGKGGGGDGGGTRDANNGGTRKGPGGGGMGGMNPMSMLGPALAALAAPPPQPVDPNQNQQQQMASVTCGPGVVAPQCQGQAAAQAQSDSWNKANTGASNFQVASTKNSGFNPAAGPTPGTGMPGAIPAQDPNLNQPIPTTQVPNGGTPFGAAPQGGGGASLGGGGGGGAMQAASTHLPDANALTSHSQFAGMNQGMSTAAGGGGGGFGGYGSHGGMDQPINYADWLPKSPGAVRALAGGNMRPMQIQSKEVNIWTRISDHIKSRCALGLLRDCVP